jgi:ssRNA-specific RNase YbeY (16S rRNA maturation enzyme)
MKIGDKVRFTNNIGFAAPTGSTAIIVGIDDYYNMLIQIKWIDKGKSNQMDGFYNPEHFEVIEEPLPEKWYMSLDSLSDEEIKQCNEWRKSVCTACHEHSLNCNHLLLNCHNDGSYYFSSSNIGDLKYYRFADKIEEITFEQFKKHILKQETKIVMSKQKLTVSITDVLEIHRIACDTWKSKIATDYLSIVDKNQNITFKQYEVDAMFKAAIGDQLPVLERIFGAQHKEYTLKDIANGKLLFKSTENDTRKLGMIEVRSDSEYKDKAFWLSYLYNWELKRDSSNELVLIPTPKY